MTRPNLAEIEKELNKLSSTLKLNYSFTANTNKNLTLSDKESEIVVKIEAQINVLQTRLDKKLKSPVPSFIIHKDKEKLKSKIEQYKGLQEDILFIESELNNIKSIIDSHGFKMDDDTKRQLISKFNSTITKGNQRLEKSCKNIDNPDIKRLAKNYLEALEKVNAPDKNQKKSHR